LTVVGPLDEQQPLWDGVVPDRYSLSSLLTAKQ